MEIKSASYEGWREGRPVERASSGGWGMAEKLLSGGEREREGFSDRERGSDLVALGFFSEGIEKEASVRDIERVW